MAKGFRNEPAPTEMKTKSVKTRANGAALTREELLAAHQRALKRVQKMTPQEGFESLVRAGIYTRDGDLTPRCGG